MKSLPKNPFVLAGLLASFTAVHADLVGHWKFDEGSGTTYADSSPNGNDARPAGTTETWSTDVAPTGIANPAALNFDGVGSYVDTPYVGIDGNAPRTVAFWIKTTATNTHGIVAWGNSLVNGEKWHIRVNNSAGNGPLGAIRTESQGDFTIGTTPVNDGTWHHIASVYPDGGGELGTVLHYVDGVLDAPGGNNASTQPVITNTAADPVTIGRRTQSGANNYFPGLVDDVRIYDRSLSAQEIMDLMGDTPDEDGLVLYMPFDEGSGETIDDLGSGDNGGTLIGAPDPIFPTWSGDAPSHLSASLLFAGPDEILYTDFPGLGGTASRSLTFWFKTTLTGDNGILGWGNSGGDGLKWHARINTGAADGPVGTLRLEHQGGRTVATTPVTDGEWHHGAIIFEEDADPDISDVVFYLDGELDPVSMFTSVPINTQIEGAGALPVMLGGRDQTGTLRGFEGNLADMRIYDTGLTQEEVVAIMNGTDGQRLQLEITEDSGHLSITWESRDGMLYNLRSETDLSAGNPADWPIYDGNQDLAATPPLNTINFELPADPERYFVVEEFPAPPVAIFADDFESGQGDWTVGSDGAGGTVWELGTPTNVGPPTAHSPANCFGTNLTGDYALDANVWLRSPSIDLTTAGGATLNYFQFFDIEEGFDSGRVAVLDASDNSELAVLQDTLDGVSTDWESVSRSLPAAALGKAIILEFRLQSDAISNFAGWYLDDVEVTVP